MRFQYVASGNSNTDFVKPEFQKKDSFHYLLEDIHQAKQGHHDPKRVENLSSPSISSESTQCDDLHDLEEMNIPKSKHRLNVERRHKNFQIKKKTEVIVVLLAFNFR